MRSNRRSGTRPERLLRSAIHARGLRFRKDHRIDLPHLCVRADVVFPRARVAVFVDGCFWHRCPDHASYPRRNAAFWAGKLSRNVERDRRVDLALVEAGWTAVRCWEHEPPRAAADRVVAALAEARSEGAAR